MAFLSCGANRAAPLAERWRRGGPASMCDRASPNAGLGFGADCEGTLSLVRPPKRPNTRGAGELGADDAGVGLGPGLAPMPVILSGPNGEDLGDANYTVFYHGVRESLPTTAERVAMRRAGIVRDMRVARRSHYATSFHMQVFNLYDNSVVSPVETQRQSPLLRCYYIAHTRAHVAQLGKRAFRRVQARRKLREAARRVLPRHAVRGLEFVIRTQAEALFMSQEDIEAELMDGLKATRSYVGNQSGDAFVQDRPFLSDKAAVSWRRWRRASRSLLLDEAKRREDGRGDVNGIDGEGPGRGD